MRPCAVMVFKGRIDRGLLRSGRLEKTVARHARLRACAAKLLPGLIVQIDQNDTCIRLCAKRSATAWPIPPRSSRYDGDFAHLCLPLISLTV